MILCTVYGQLADICNGEKRCVETGGESLTFSLAGPENFMMSMFLIPIPSLSSLLERCSQR